MERLARQSIEEAAEEADQQRVREMKIRREAKEVSKKPQQHNNSFSPEKKKE